MGLCINEKKTKFIVLSRRNVDKFYLRVGIFGVVSLGQIVEGW